MKRIVPDTNVVVSGLLWSGAPHSLIATALAAQADLIVTGDKPFLGVGAVGSIRIITVGEALAVIESG